MMRGRRGHGGRQTCIVTHSRGLRLSARASASKVVGEVVLYLLFVPVLPFLLRFGLAGPRGVIGGGGWMASIESGAVGEIRCLSWFGRPLARGHRIALRR